MTLFLSFSRFFPVVAIAEIKSILKISGNQYRREQMEEVKDEPAYVADADSRLTYKID
jgi:hypothetical protein